MRQVGIAAAAATLWASGAMAATVTTAWEEFRGGQDACLATGSEAVSQAGFRASISGDRQTVFGWRNDDSIAIRCIGNRDLAVIFIYVERRQDNDDLLRVLRAAYQRGVKR